MQAQGKLDKCQSCHRQEPALETDYVFRDPYLPQKLKERLK